MEQRGVMQGGGLYHSSAEELQLLCLQAICKANCSYIYRLHSVIPIRSTERNRVQSYKYFFIRANKNNNYVFFRNNDGDRERGSPLWGYAVYTYHFRGVTLG